MAVTITSVSVDDLPGIERQYGEGLIIQDCDLNPYEAANLVNQTFTHGGILLERTEFQKVMVFHFLLRASFNMKMNSRTSGSGCSNMQV